MTAQLIAALAAAPEISLAGLAAFPWRQGAMLGLPVVGTYAVRLLRRRNDR